MKRVDIRKRPDNELEKVLKGNPFKPELIKKWKHALQSFLEGRCKLSDLCFVLDSDRDAINKYQEKNATNEKKRLHLELIPQPFQGNPRAPVWLLMLNPGYSCIDRYDHLGLCPSCDKNIATSKTKFRHDVFDCGKDKRIALQKRQNRLLQQLRLGKGCSFSVLEEMFNTLQGCPDWKGDGGYRWWENMLFGTNGHKGFLLPECGAKPNAKLVEQKLFVLECNPYHSINFDGEMVGSGSEYIEFWAKLISWAIKTKKYFIVRGESVVRVLNECKLKVNSTNSVKFSSWQKTALTRNNLHGRKKKEICRILERQTTTRKRFKKAAR